MTDKRWVRIMDRTFAPVLFTVVGLFATWAVVTALNDDHRREVIEYKPQTIERIEQATGAITVPLVDGYDGPAVCIGDTVPVRGSVTNLDVEPVPVRGSVTWEQIPPGPRYVINYEVPRILDPGETALTFENEIPARVVDRVLDEREASQWEIRGIVEPLVPNALEAVWGTPRVWIVDCG